MKRLSSVLSILIIISVIYWSFYDLKPTFSEDKISLVTEFSLDKAIYHLKNISKKPHYTGAKNHKYVQNYIVDVLEKMGLKTHLQTQTIINSKGRGTTVQNIICKIKGTENGKALLLLTHYDSSPHSSYGASDAGSGVVTILEGVRAFLAKNKSHKNDIIIVITDAEELGLLGATAFVNHHKWAKDVGLVLNFEARGSGGPSYMLMETNGKNSKLLSEFMAAKHNFPLANSLMYSIYKKLPNDTDLTVFRENANINGYNFAFIDDHFDYHTAQDTYLRLDKETLLHQADYFSTSINYFANSDLSHLSSKEDFIYVNFPFLKLLTYPFAWVTPMFITALVLFILLLIYGFSSKKLTLSGILKGFIPFLISLVICGVISYFGWQLLQIIHPYYKDILHGFTYNGYTYIFAFVFLNLFILLGIYKLFKKQKKTRDLLIAPIFTWLIINFFICIYLKGAGFFIIPVFIGLLILAISLFMYLDERSSKILFTILSTPTIYIFAPFIQMFPVGLGLKNIFISSILMVLLFGIMVLSFYNKKAKWMLKSSGVLTIVFFGLATYNSNFTIENKKPNSLVYIQNSDAKTAYFGTYNNTLDSFTQQIFDSTASKGSIKNAETKSKYNTRFRYHKKTEFKNILSSDMNINFDTIIDSNRFLEIEIIPNRKINKLEFTSNNKITFKQFKVNDVLVLNGDNYIANKRTFLSYILSNSDKTLTLSFSIAKDQEIDIILNEISFDLLTHPNFSFKPRSEKMMPMPFVTNDAIIISKKLKI